MSEQDRISPYNTNTKIKQTVNIKGLLVIQYQIVQANIRRIVWETVKRIPDEILLVKGLIDQTFSSNATQCG